MSSALRFLFPTLSRFRGLIQAICLFFGVWGANVVGFYTANKISTALPALSCAYSSQNAAYCVLIPLQHQMHHRVGEALVKAQQIGLEIILPSLISIGTFMLFFAVLGKAFCGWVCPLGTVQEWLNRIGRRLQLPQHDLSRDGTSKTRPLKWLVLLGLVFAIPLTVGMGVSSPSLGNPYCDVCPSRIVSTLLAGDVSEFAIHESNWVKFALGGVANTLFGFVVIAALAIRQPFCRICPMLAMNAIFRRFSFASLSKKQHDKCEKCGICHKACPMDIHEIHTEHGHKAYHDDCTLCGRCVEYCPDEGVISIKFGPWSLFSSSLDYYKRRIKKEKPNGVLKPINFVKTPKGMKNGAS